MNPEERLLYDINGGGETEEQAAARVLQSRLRAALRVAPELVEFLRAKVLYSAGRTERGEKPTDRTPLLTGTVDDADELYIALLEWVSYWAERFYTHPPTPGVTWRTVGGIRREGPDVQAGFRAGVTPAQARHLVHTQTRWLLSVDEQLTGPLVNDYRSELAHLIWSIRAGSGMWDARRPILEPATRFCPACDADEVRVEFFGEPIRAAIARGERLTPVAMKDETEEQMMNQFVPAVEGVQVRCAACGWLAPARASQIARWLA